MPSRSHDKEIVNIQYYADLQGELVRGGHLARILDESFTLLMVLDGDRRLIHCTKGILELAGAGRVEELWGKRPGDFLQCVNAEEAGCGAGGLCGECGALLGIRGGLDGLHAETECSLTLRSGDRLQSREFRIRAIPLELDGRPFVAMSLHDWTHEKRCRSLEQVFLHDILNTVGAVKGILHFLRTDLSGDNRELLDTILPYFDLCVDEISAQQKLLAAENNELRLVLERFSLAQLLQGLANIHAQHALGRGKEISVEMQTGSDEVISDRTIVHRMCMNLLKNALEATPEGGAVLLQGSVENGHFHVSVRNPGTMPEDVQRHLFRRSFSTKGQGRGLGVYSVHLLCTNYLRGRVWFETDESGTAFHLHVPQGEHLQQD
jgi:signal transduction histidine kinase